jgi:hypothetical protein
MYYSYKLNCNRTKQVNKAWVVPREQVVEFFSGPIDYNKLIAECMRSSVIVNMGKGKKK